jgi:protein associated with RNAse G/E
LAEWGDKQEEGEKKRDVQSWNGTLLDSNITHYKYKLLQINFYSNNKKHIVYPNTDQQPILKTHVSMLRTFWEREKTFTNYSMQEANPSNEMLAFIQ